MIGRVLSWNSIRRYGWVRPDAGPKDFFAHVGDLVDVTELRRGQSVTFTPLAAHRGPRATRVRVLDQAPAESRRSRMADEPSRSRATT
jgi:cold shock CspA family protein